MLCMHTRNAGDHHSACYAILWITTPLVQPLHDVLDTVSPPVRPCRDTQEDVSTPRTCVPSYTLT